MKQTFVPLPRNGIFRLRQVEQNRAIVKHHSITRFRKKILHNPEQSLRRHR
jgi:hypothetical protein